MTRTRARALSALAALLVAGVVATACQNPISTLSRPIQGSPVPASPSPAGALAAADATFHRGDYDAAEKVYGQLVQAGVPGSASHQAVFLAYQSRFTEAIKAAQDGVAAASDSGSLARLTRALDWAESLPEAVRAGARAVTTPPVDPLAHVYYAEALADSGLYADAERQLRAAEQLRRDAYTTAETDREWANYYRARGDQAQELNHIQLALKAQPRFPERALELARYYYGGKKIDQAHGQLDAVRKAHPADYGVLVSAGLTALFGSDSDAATALYDAALAVRPDASEAALGKAEIAVAGRRDFQGARQILVAALQKSPDSAQVYQYLRHLDLLVLKVDPADDLRPAGSGATAKLSEARAAALGRVNDIRAQAGLTALTEDANIASGAEAHAYYYLFNLGQQQLAGLGIHGEDAALPGFTGVNSLERSRHFGYRGVRGSEVINHVFSPVAAVQVWRDSVYHRFPIMSRETATAGYGEASIGVISIQVIDFGLSAPGVSDPVVYPVPDQKDVPPAFVGHEIPDPAPQGVSYPVGYPVTVQAGARSKLQVSSGRLLDARGADVQSVALAPGQQVEAFEWSIFALQPLKPGTLYTVELNGTLDGQAYSKRWSFTTAAVA